VAGAKAQALKSKPLASRLLASGFFLRGCCRCFAVGGGRLRPAALRPGGLRPISGCRLRGAGARLPPPGQGGLPRPGPGGPTRARGPGGGPDLRPPRQPRRPGQGARAPGLPLPVLGLLASVQAIRRDRGLDVEGFELELELELEKIPDRSGPRPAGRFLSWESLFSGAGCSWPRRARPGELALTWPPGGPFGGLGTP